LPPRKHVKTQEKARDVAKFMRLGIYKVFNAYLRSDRQRPRFQFTSLTHLSIADLGSADLSLMPGGKRRRSTKTLG